MLDEFDKCLSGEQRFLLHSLKSPDDIQSLLHEIPYSADPFNRCPLRVLQDRVANCFDGALLAAVALRYLGYPPLILNMFVVEGLDDEHVLAIYKRNGCFGAIAKSNFLSLGFREPVYRSLRELIMSYFDFYFNVYGVKALRSYSPTLNLQLFDGVGWMWSDEGLEPIIERLDRMRRIPILTEQMVATLVPADPRLVHACLTYAVDAGLYRPKG